jgi:large subunit ribosomal protein L6
VTVPAGVTVTIADGNVVTVKGPKGTLTQTFSPILTIKVENGELTVTRPNDLKESRSLHGLTRSLLHNMVVGVTDGFKKELEINGIGYRAVKQGKQVVLNVGYSHQVTIEETDEISLDVPQPTQIIVSGCDKQKVGQYAAEVRAIRPPEPYKGKGIKYADEVIRRKEGKTGAKKK